MKRYGEQRIHDHEISHDQTREHVRPLEEVHHHLHHEKHNQIVLRHRRAFLPDIPPKEVSVPVQEKAVDCAEQQKDRAHLKVYALILHIPEIAEPNVCGYDKRNYDT